MSAGLGYALGESYQLTYRSRDARQGASDDEKRCGSPIHIVNNKEQYHVRFSATLRPGRDPAGAGCFRNPAALITASSRRAE